MYLSIWILIGPWYRRDPSEKIIVKCGTELRCSFDPFHLFHHNIEWLSHPKWCHLLVSHRQKESRFSVKQRSCIKLIWIRLGIIFDVSWCLCQVSNEEWSNEFRMGSRSAVCNLIVRFSCFKRFSLSLRTLEANTPRICVANWPLWSPHRLITIDRRDNEIFMQVPWPGAQNIE
jgi:hypothetical protein